MEAPFPALGKTIIVKNFLPGSGTEVSYQRASGPASLVPMAGEAVSFSKASTSVVSPLHPPSVQSIQPRLSSWEQSVRAMLYSMRFFHRYALYLLGFFSKPKVSHQSYLGLFTFWAYITF